MVRPMPAEPPKTQAETQAVAPPQAASPSPVSVFLRFLRLGLTAFGGPAMVPHIRAMAVRQGWVDEDDFATGMAVCQSVPGATAMQVAAFTGLRAGGVPCGLAAYAGFGLPAFCLITALSMGYAASRDAGAAMAAFAGLQVVVCALIAHAALDFARRYLQSRVDTLLALGTGLVFGLRGNPVLAILGACLAGVLLHRDVRGAQPGPAARRRGSWGRDMAWLLGGAAAFVGLVALIRPDLLRLCLVMMKVDLFAFGGGYVSLPLMLHEVAEVRHWLTPQAFMDGIALGQVTPGPIVITSAFVGYLVFGLAGAAVAAVSAFTPSLLILAGVLPFFDRLQRSAVFQRALRASLASLVGLMAAMAGRFVEAAQWSPAAVVIAVAALAALRKGVDILWVVLAGAGAAIVFL